MDAPFGAKYFYLSYLKNTEAPIKREPQRFWIIRTLWTGSSPVHTGLL